MTAAVTLTLAPVAPRSQLALLTLLVLTAHVLVLLGLPHWMRSAPMAGAPSVFLIRTITPEPLRPAAAGAVDTPEPLPPAPKSKPVLHSPQHRVPSAAASAAADDMPISALPLPPDPLAAVRRQTVPPASARPDGSEAQMPSTPIPAPLVQLPRPAQMAYQAIITQGGRLRALASTIDWRHDGQSYDLRWKLGSAGEGVRATGRITAHGLEPVQAIGASQPTDMLYPLSTWIELGALIAGNPSQYQVGSRIALPVMGSDSIPRQADYVIVDDADMAAGGLFDGQSLPALHLVHEPADAHEAHVDLWLGKLLDYLPIRLLVIQSDGHRLDMTMQGIHG